MKHLRAIGTVVLCSLLAACPRNQKTVEPTPAPATPTPAPTPTPPPYVPNKKLETGKIFNGMQYRVTLETEYGTTATTDRNDPSSYVAELTVKVKVPKPHQNLAELSKLNAKLPDLLPGLSALLQSARVSPFFDEIYRLKVDSLRSSLNRLDNLISRHNFYDVETILELQDPQSKRRALLLQSEMDVDSDGSDSDRVPEVDGSSATFQPFTSYKWGKKTTMPNSFITPRETKIAQYETELAGSPGAARARELKDAIARLKTEVADLKKYSFLVGTVDPFVVLPVNFFAKNKGPFSPAIGDYCVVIHDQVLYPAVIGDAGPAYKAGEASLRICKQISAKASVANRPEDDLKVTYLIFPGSGERPFDVPNLDKWRDKCDALLREIGGYQGQLFQWEDLTKPKLPPEPLAPVTPAPSTPALFPAAPTPPPLSPKPTPPTAPLGSPRASR